MGGGRTDGRTDWRNWLAALSQTTFLCIRLVGREGGACPTDRPTDRPSFRPHAPTARPPATAIFNFFCSFSPSFVCSRTWPSAKASRNLLRRGRAKKTHSAAAAIYLGEQLYLQQFVFNAFESRPDGRIHGAEKNHTNKWARSSDTYVSKTFRHLDVLCISMLRWSLLCLSQQFRRWRHHITDRHCAALRQIHYYSRVAGEMEKSEREGPPNSLPKQAIVCPFFCSHAVNAPPTDAFFSSQINGIEAGK